MRRVLAALIAAALAFLLLLNVRLHRPSAPADTRAQLRHLERALGRGAGEEMQTLFPEGYVFTWSLYGLASAQTARALPAGDPDRAHLPAQTRRAMAAVASERARSTFTADMSPRYGAFYASWVLYLRAEYVRSASPATLTAAELAAFTAECDRFAAALAASPTPFLETYPGEVWPDDTAPGIAALGIHDAVVGPRYGVVIRRWVTAARARLHPRLAVLSHAADPGTGDPGRDVRGESLALAARLLVDADPRFAREHYRVLRERFLEDRLGVPGVREYPRDAPGSDDVDSGPILLGFSGPAIVDGAAAARVHGDPAVADGLLGSVEMAGLPLRLGGRRIYALGRLPVGDAFIAWARSSPAGRQGPWPPAPVGGFLGFHLLSAAVAVLLLGVGWMVLRPGVARRIATQRRP